jgi:hypothetical protein
VATSTTRHVRGGATRLVGTIALAALGIAALADVAAAKTVSDAAYAKRVCAAVATILEPIQALRALDPADLGTYQSQGVRHLDAASEAAEEAERALEKVTSKSGGTKAARTFDFFFNTRAEAYDDASRALADGDPDDPAFASDVDALVDVAADTPFGLVSPFESITVTKPKVLRRALAADATCQVVREEF